MRILLGAVMLFAILILAIRTAEAEPPAFEIKCRKAEDSVTARTEERRTVFAVATEMGIGGATIGLKAGRWPSEVVLRLHYVHGGRLDHLEGFELTTDRMQASGRVGPTDKLPFHLLDADGKFNRDAPDAGQLQLGLKQAGDDLEIALPANLFAGSKQVKVEWIDAYR